MNDWTPEMVEQRLVEAAAVLRRLPAVRVGGYFSTWPKMKVEFSDLVGQTPEPMRLPPPPAAAISRMEATLSWTIGLDPIDAKIVWLRAGGERWKTICWKVGLARASPSPCSCQDRDRESWAADRLRHAAACAAHPRMSCRRSVVRCSGTSETSS